MWKLRLFEAYRHDLKTYSTAKPQAVVATLFNLQRYVALLEVTSCHNKVEAAYLHDEGYGIVSIDQHGSGNFEEDFRIYSFADQSARLLYLLVIGKADEKDADMEYCKDLVFYIRTPMKT